MTISYGITELTTRASSSPTLTMEIEGNLGEMSVIRDFIDRNFIGRNNLDRYDPQLIRHTLNTIYGRGNGKHTRLFPKKLIFSGPCTILEFSDGSKSIVRCTKSEKFDHEKGVMMAYLKHVLPSHKWKAFTKQYHDMGTKEKIAAEALIRVGFGEDVFRYLMKMIDNAVMEKEA